MIMIGEVRDPTTAATAVRAAKSGSIVFATLHAATATAAVNTMLAMDVHPHFLATSLLGVIAQRLVRTLCPKCKQPIDISESPGTFEACGRGLHLDRASTFTRRRAAMRAASRATGDAPACSSFSACRERCAVSSPTGSRWTKSAGRP